MALSRLARVLIAVLVVVPVAPAMAQPATQSEAVEQYRELNVEAEKLNENFLQANEDKNVKQAELDKATADLAVAQRSAEQAKTTQQRFRGEVDELSSARFRGARFDKLSALLTGSSQRDFLDRSSALGVLATESNKTLAEMAKAVTAASAAEQQAAQAQRRATEVRDAAARLAEQIAAQRKELDAKIVKVKAELERLTAEQKQELQGPPDPAPPPAPPAPPKTSTKPAPPPSAGPPPVGGPADAATRAVNAAMSRRGDTYVWGGTRPGGFDCSGLTLWSYAQAGIELPRTSRAQYGVGRAVPKDQLRAGDLLFYGTSATSIHHVAMYIGDGNIVHASTFGVPVKSGPLSSGGRDYFGAKRIVG
ncbi:cell wall-associated NlpC family hydrolase [Kibdelosporangium banguiense]|uniref:Cell wall-associated NlpC family hydrolase n=1 Tax=Kibdelosporangium banguiense TaxID=1365924 RepID=A0ABS4TR01_9PSEU|nr:NlpC/P60 family protein [Kibdelosporangium banguiense]MBP2326839.1 cell wall-associated NlpC family hydrolase [Kibdelosporangium banguiense]